MIDYSKEPSEADLKMVSEKLTQMELFSEPEMQGLKEKTVGLQDDLPVDYKTHDDNIQNHIGSVLGDTIDDKRIDHNIIKTKNQPIVNRDDYDDGYQIDF